MLDKYYLPFVPLAKKIDYLFLFNLYDLAEYNQEKNCYDTITYKNYKELAELLNISSKQLARKLEQVEYNQFFTIDKEKKQIYLNNDFNKERNNKTPFIVLKSVEVRFLRQEKNDLLCKYFCYLRYYSGKNKDKCIDTTTRQFLLATGYSDNSQYVSKVSEFNNLLVKNGFLSAVSFRDDKQKKRLKKHL